MVNYVCLLTGEKEKKNMHDESQSIGHVRTQPQLKRRNYHSHGGLCNGEKKNLDKSSGINLSCFVVDVNKKTNKQK